MAFRTARVTVWVVYWMENNEIFFCCLPTKKKAKGFKKEQLSGKKAKIDSDWVDARVNTNELC